MERVNVTRHAGADPRTGQPQASFH